MAQHQDSSEGHDGPPPGDPWHAFGYLVAGVLFYGAVGWVLDRWLGTSFLVVIGILLGAGLGIYMTFARFGGFATSQDKQQD
jgi:ATP synthase protein I